MLFLGDHAVTAATVRRSCSREHEHDAGLIGLRHAAKTGFDPRAAITFWRWAEVLDQEEQERLALLRTPPANARRLARMEVQLPAVTRL